MTIGDLAAIARCVRHAAPDNALEDLIGQGEALDDQAFIRAVSRLLLHFPELLGPLAACVARRDLAEAERWSPRDCLALLTAALEANDWRGMAEDVRRFFAAARRMLESAGASRDASTPSASS